jgi:hypothetical protein
VVALPLPEEDRTWWGPGRAPAVKASRDGYEVNILPTGWTTGTPEDAIDCAADLYLGDLTE